MNPPQKILSLFFPTLHTIAPAEQRLTALKQLSRWAYQFSPTVAIDSLHKDEARNARDKRSFGLNLEVSGTERLFKSHEQLLEQIHTACEEKKLPVRSCIAPTLGCAWALSRYALEPRIITTQIKSSLAPLPIAALRISQKTIIALKELHIQLIGQLLALPTSELRKRFELELILKLNAALGALEEPLNASQIRKLPTVSHRFAEPVLEKEVIQNIVYALFQRLHRGFITAQKNFSQLKISYQLEDGNTVEQGIQLSIPSHKEAHLKKLIAHKLEALCVVRGIESITLSAPGARAMQTKQLGGDSADLLPLGELLDEIKDKLGHERLQTLRVTSSHIPERSYSYQPLDSLLELAEPCAKLTTAQRPSVLFAQPKPITAISSLPDGPPYKITYQHESHTIRAAIGPERIAPAWWGTDPELTSDRDYFRVQLPSGTWLWIFRKDGAWFIHGIWA